LHQKWRCTINRVCTEITKSAPKLQTVAKRIGGVGCG
jgi:hypothetical protein